MEPEPDAGDLPAAAVDEEIRRRLRAQRMRGDFAQIHVAPSQLEDVPDVAGARLVVLGPEHPHVAGATSPALDRAGALLADAGRGVPRVYRNMLVFAAPDPAPLDDLRRAAGRLLAGGAPAHGEEVARLVGETWRWLLTPAAGGWTRAQVTGRDDLAMRASRGLRADGRLFVDYPPGRLRADLDRFALWPAGADHVSLADVWEAFARSVELPRLRSSAVLAAAVVAGVASPACATETFAYADGFDPETRRYAGLVAGRAVVLRGSGLLVRPAAARAQLAAEPGPG